MTTAAERPAGSWDMTSDGRGDEPNFPALRYD